MFDFLRKQEEKPFSYASIEMRKSSKKFTWLILGLISILMVVGFFLTR